jgi:hypothetical protein
LGQKTSAWTSIKWILLQATVFHFWKDQKMLIKLVGAKFLVSETYFDGYACVPYMHDHRSIEIKDSWQASKNIENMYFVTATFAADSKPYFPSYANHYLLVKFTKENIAKEIEKYQQIKTSFVFNMSSEIFERDVEGIMNFVSVYYLEYTKFSPILQWSSQKMIVCARHPPVTCLPSRLSPPSLHFHTATTLLSWRSQVKKATKV